ncbi:MAG: CIA30 family protein [Gammaproteobacteria bacterium]
MNSYRRSLLAAAGAASVAPLLNSWAAKSPQGNNLMLSNFANGYMLPGVAWRGFSDRVMGGISNASLDSSRVDGKNCIRLSGNVTRESNGGFIQMAMYFGRNYNELNGSAYKGVELMVYGNNEDYNLHIRTAECSWYDQSYRMSFFAEPQWQRLRVPWDAFQPNNMSQPLDSSRLQRIAVLGWMREFQADIALAEISLYS